VTILVPKTRKVKDCKRVVFCERCGCLVIAQPNRRFCKKCMKAKQYVWQKNVPSQLQRRAK